MSPVLQILFGPIRCLYRDLSSPVVLFLAPSHPPHILPHSSHSLFCFLPSFCSVFFLFVWLPVSCFASFSCCSHLFYIFCFLLFFLIIVGFLISCVLVTSPHLPSSYPSGPETPSFSAHRPLPPLKVLTPQHTALCAAVHTLGLWRGLVAKACLSPFQCHSWYVCWGWDK